MSPNKTLKRVALIAATALAIGGISAVSAYATQATPTLGATTASALTASYTTVTLNAGSTDKYYTITSSGTGTLLFPVTAPATTGLTGGSSELWFSGATPGAANFAGTEVLTFSANSATAGTQTITVQGNTSSSITEVITWGSAAVVSAANSVVASNTATNISGTPKTTVATEDTNLSSVNTVNTLGGGAYVQVYSNATTPALISTDVISASVSGPGILKIGSTYSAAAAATGGRAVSNAAAGSTAFVLINGDGTAGTSTVTVSDSTTGVVLGTFSVVFYALTVAKIVVTTNTNVPLTTPTGFVPLATEGIRSNAVVAGQAPVSIVVSDANGNVIPSADGITVTSATPAIATVGALTYDAANASSFVNITPVSEGSTVLSFSDTATGKVVATTTVLVVSPIVAKVVASVDAASYAPGTKVVYTLTATDAAGRQIADGTYTGLFTTAPTSNVGLQGALPGTGALSFVNGVNNSTVYSPVTATNVVIVGGTTSSAAFVAPAEAAITTNSALFSVTGSVNTGPGTIQAAIDAAVAATTAATAAGVQATAAVTAATAAGVQAAAAVAGVAVVNTRLTALLSKVAALIALMARLIKKAHA